MGYLAIYCISGVSDIASGAPDFLKKNKKQLGEGVTGREERGYSVYMYVARVGVVLVYAAYI